VLGTEDPYTLSQEDFNIWMAKRALAESPGENLSGPSKRSRTMPAGVQHGTPYPVPLAGGTAPANRPLPLHARNTRSRTAAMTQPDSRSAAPAVPEPQRKSATNMSSTASQPTERAKMPQRPSPGAFRPPAAMPPPRSAGYDPSNVAKAPPAMSAPMSPVSRPPMSRPPVRPLPLPTSAPTTRSSDTPSNPVRAERTTAHANSSGKSVPPERRSLPPEVITSTTKDNEVIDMDTDDTQQKNDSEESNLPRKIRLLVEELKGSEPFNIEKFL